MIEGYNPSSSYFEEYDFDDFVSCGSVLSGPQTINSVIDNLEERRMNALNGGTNCIPLPFVRFRSEIPGIEQGQYVVVSAVQKTCKTQLANYLYLFHTLDYAFKHPKQCSVHIIYFALEESVQKIIERYMSHLLWKLDGKRVTPTDLRSTSDALSGEVLDLLKSDRYQERLHFFEENVQFETEDTNPTGILRVCERYARSVGVYKSHKMTSKGLSGKEVEVFDSYTPNDPNHYKIVIIDHIGLVDKEQGFKTKDAVDKMSEYFVKYLRNRYGFTCVAIQQQASESEGLEAMKQKRMVPSVATLGDSKYTGRDADLVLGLFDPSKYGLAMWPPPSGYRIADNMEGPGLGNHSRFMYVLANRNGEMGGICPLFFDGAVCDFEELPKPDNHELIKRFYEKANNLKAYKRSRKLALFTLLNIKSQVSDGRRKGSFENSSRWRNYFSFFQNKRHK